MSLGRTETHRQSGRRAKLDTPAKLDEIKPLTNQNDHNQNDHNQNDQEGQYSQRTILALNVGSSSLKAALFNSRFNDPSSRVDSETTDLAEIARLDVAEPSDRALVLVEQWINSLGHPVPSVVGHRIVHGGTHFTTPVLIDDATVQHLQMLTPLARLHMPRALSVIEASRRLFERVPQVACFDTGFHSTLPRIAFDLALPASLRDEGIRRYGFHGLNCEHVVETVDTVKLRHAVIAHLGSGCSLTAIRDGSSVDTSMGFTPLGGIPMGTRSGDLDPGVITHLLRSGHSLEDVEQIVERESGLHALSDGTSDMRELLRRADVESSDAARFAIETFCQRVAKGIAAYTVDLGGLDTIVFTGGIGEHCAPIRERIIDRLTHLSDFEVLVVPANEERVIARHASTFVH